MASLVESTRRFRKKRWQALLESRVGGTLPRLFYMTETMKQSLMRISQKGTKETSTPRSKDPETLSKTPVSLIRAMTTPGFSQERGVV